MGDLPVGALMRTTMCVLGGALAAVLLSADQGWGGSVDKRDPPCVAASGHRAVNLPKGDLLLLPNPSVAEVAGDYRDRLATTALGRPRRSLWCVWLEPATSEGPATRWVERWHAAAARALAQWEAVLPIVRVADPDTAQVRIRRRRPPLKRQADGRTRASHGRATLALLEVKRGSIWQLEPAVEVLLSPEQRPEAIEATALHELGHAFGLWGHSDEAGDAMAATPGAQPVQQLSPRDRATLRWLDQQPTPFAP